MGRRTHCAGGPAAEEFPARKALSCLQIVRDRPYVRADLSAVDPASGFGHDFSVIRTSAAREGA